VVAVVLVDLFMQTDSLLEGVVHTESQLDQVVHLRFKTTQSEPVVQTQHSVIRVERNIQEVMLQS
jgi:hypothetical protein